MCGAWAYKALSPKLFRLVCGICNKFLVFDVGVLVLSCLAYSSLTYIEGHILVCICKSQAES